MNAQSADVAEVALSAGGGSEIVGEPATNDGATQAIRAGGGSEQVVVNDSTTQGNVGYNTVQSLHKNNDDAELIASASEGPSMEHGMGSMSEADKAAHSSSSMEIESILDDLKKDVRDTMKKLSHLESKLSQGMELQEQFCENTLRNEMREEVKFDKNTATSMYLEAHRKSATATEEKNVVDSLCKLHGLFMPENATQININVDKVQQLERLSDAELLKLAGADTKYLEPANDKQD